MRNLLKLNESHNPWHIHIKFVKQITRTIQSAWQRKSILNTSFNATSLTTFFFLLCIYNSISFMSPKVRVVGSFENDYPSVTRNEFHVLTETKIHSEFRANSLARALSLSLSINHIYNLYIHIVILTSTHNTAMLYTKFCHLHQCLCKQIRKEVCLNIV